MIKLRPHPSLPNHYIAKAYGFSVVAGPYCIGGGGYEVMNPDGEVRGFNTIAECNAYIKGYIDS